MSIMDVDDWKVITQGGWTAHDCKWKDGKGFINNAPIFITCQKELDFGSEEDNLAMDNRLNKYFFRSLLNIKKEAAGWIKDHPMHCIIWAAQQCEQLSSQDKDDEACENVFASTGLSREDRWAIVSLNLDSEPQTDIGEQEVSESLTLASSQEEEIRDEESTTDDDHIMELLITAKTLSGHNIGKARMIDRLIQMVKAQQRHIQEQQSRHRAAEHAKRVDRLKRLGVDEDLLDLLPMDPYATMPSQLRQQISQLQGEKKKREEQEEQARVKSLFLNPWLQSKEKELVQLQKEINSCMTENVKRAKQYLSSTVCNAIKSFHVNHKWNSVKKCAYLWDCYTRKMRILLRHSTIFYPC